MTHATVTPLHTDTLADVVRESFLAPYDDATLRLYTYQLDQWFTWCAERDIDPLAATRTHVEAYYRHRIHTLGNRPSTVRIVSSILAGFYKIAAGDDLIAKNPVDYARKPKVNIDTSAQPWFTRTELSRFLVAAADVSPKHHALAHLLAVLGLRASEACAVRVEDYRDGRAGHRTLRLVGKGSKAATMPLPPAQLRALEEHRQHAGIETGYLFTAPGGGPMSRHTLTAVVGTICRHANLPVVRPHALRHSAITGALDSGVSLRDVQAFARHADPKTTIRYDRGQGSMDRHAVHVLSAFVTG